MRLFILAPLALLACDGGSDSTDSGTDSGSDSAADSSDSADTDTDTDTDTDSDTDADSDTDTDTDTDSDTDADTTLGFDLSGEYGGTTIELRWLDPVSIGQEPLVYGDAFLDVAASGDHVTVSAPAPDASLLVEVEPEKAPGMLLATFIPALYTDVDASGSHDVGESYVGVGLEWLVYATGDLSALAMFGVVEGWNSMTFSPEGIPIVGDITAVPVAANLFPVAEVTVSGTYAGDPDGMRLVAAPGVAFDGGVYPALLVDQPLTASWSLTLSGEPPGEHVYEPALIGFAAAIEVPYTYVDVNGDEAWDDGDSPGNAACAGTTPVAMLWLPSPGELAQATTLLFAGGSAGWSTILLDADATLVDAATASSLEITPECVQGAF